jgi:DNA-directed RNA polymerase subunit RPC12/RpoP
MTRRTQYVCARCGNPIGMWHFGWKHQTGGGSRPSCAKPEPMLREEYEAPPKPPISLREFLDKEP